MEPKVYVQLPPALLGQAVPSGLKLLLSVFMCRQGNMMTDNPKQLQSDVRESDMETIPKVSVQRSPE